MKKILCSLLMLSLLLNHGVVAFAETLNSTSDSTSKQQSESNDLDEKKQLSNADVSTDLNKSKDNTNVSDSKKIQEVDKNHNDTSIIPLM